MARDRPSERRKLPFWATVGEAYRVTFFRFGALLRLSVPWLVILAILTGTFHWFIWPAQEGAKLWASVTYPFVVPTFVVSAISVGWVRMLLGELPTGRVRPRMDSAVWRYFAWSLLFILAALMLPGALALAVLVAREIATPEGNWYDDGYGLDLLWFVGIPIWAIYWGFLFYLLTRLTLIYPAIALGRHASMLALSFRATRWNSWRVFWGGLLTLAAPLAVPLLALTVQEAFGVEPTSQFASALDSVVHDIVHVLTSMVWVSFATLAYRHLIGVDEPAPGPA